MAKNHESYIKQHISKYRNKDLTKSAILSSLKAFPDLRPKFDTFVFSDNTRKDLLCIDGTIPVSFRGAIYNIPICIWLFDTHPYNPPMCYVKPTQSMMIKSSKHVDANGRVYLPYLHEWKHPNSDLIGLIQVMTVVFSENCPVFARPANQPMATGYPGAQPPQPQLPGYPATGGYPGAQMPMPTPSYSPQGGYPGANNQYRPPPTGFPNPYQGQTPYPQGTSMPTPQPPITYPFPNTQQNQNQFSSPPAKVESQQSLSDDQIKFSLQTAVEDKLKRRMREVLQVYQNEMDALTATRDKLQEGKTRIQQLLTQLDAEQKQVEENTRELRQKNQEIEESLKKMEGREELEPEEAVTPTTPLYRQLLNLVADEMTIEDTYYYLMEALRKDVIELEVFLKHVRELSRKQYLLRAHIQKVRQTAGLTPA